jgi:hypothetical protein
MPPRLGSSWYVEEIENFQLQWFELGLEDLDELSVTDEVVTLDTGEDLKDPRGRPGRPAPQLGVERDAGEPFGLHGGADLAFDARLGDHGEEVAEHERLDPVRVLEVNRCDLGVLSRCGCAVRGSAGSGRR